MSIRPKKECPTCKGKGFITVYGEDDFQELEECRRCNGKGWIHVREGEDGDDEMANNG